MTELFEIIEEIPHSQFIETWESEERKSKHGPDGFTLQRIEELRAFKDLKCSIVRLTESGLDRLILSAHQHDRVSRVDAPGEAYPQVISKYLIWRSAGEYDECFARLDKVIQYIDLQIAGGVSLWESEFVLGRVFRPGNVALPEYYQKCLGSGLCTLNFHRFVAYGLWCADHGNQPAKVHYFTRIAP